MQESDLICHNGWNSRNVEIGAAKESICFVPRECRSVRWAQITLRAEDMLGESVSIEISFETSPALTPYYSLSIDEICSASQMLTIFRANLQSISKDMLAGAMF